MSGTEPVFPEFPNEGAFYSFAEAEDNPVVETPVEEEEVSEDDWVPQFDPKYKDDFVGLLYLGKINRSFRWANHDFVIKTLNNEELVETGMLHAKYQGTLADVMAYNQLICAAAIVSVDGKELPVPVDKTVGLIETRFNYIQKNWYQWTIDAVYTKYLELEARISAQLEEMGKA